ncbi:RNA polymerase factor sigma-54 [Desulfotalea psychrophila]|nr:RNA polymerase factor sigma-54 [Desulfotalea psychrophila]
MALELRQQLKLTQKLVMTPQLRQAIKLLQLNRLELAGALQAELRENPALEEDFSQTDQDKIAEALDSTVEPPTRTPESDVTRTLEARDSLDGINWKDYANNFDSNFSFAREIPPADAPSQFDFISEEPGLSAHLQWQLAHCELDVDEREIATYILGNLNRYGFLVADLNDIQTSCECSPDDAAYVLEVIQDLEPAGIAARNVSESLFLQLERLGKEHSLAAEIVTEHMSSLEIKDIKTIARKTGRKRPEVVKAIDFIVDNLTPYPGLPFVTEKTNYIIPDVYVRNIDGELIITLNNDDLPKLKLSQEYVAMTKGGEINKESKSYLVNKVRNAEWFIKTIHQRQRTIYRVMESILKFQGDFFVHGSTHLKPLILRDIAEDIGMHESTISRVTSNKYVHTPLGIYELKYFFSTAIPRVGGEALASESIKTLIRKIIQNEDKAKPLSDNKISEILAMDNIKLARRTVAKYREQMQIQPVKHRRKTR